MASIERSAPVLTPVLDMNIDACRFYVGATMRPKMESQEARTRSQTCPLAEIGLQTARCAPDRCGVA